MATMSEFFKTPQTKKSPMEASKSDKSISQGPLVLNRYRNYYDVNNTITTAQATNPNDQDNANYNQEQVFVSLDRNAEHMIVTNDSNQSGFNADILYAIVSHEGGQNFARERPIYPGEKKTFFNIYELRLRSPTVGLPYRVIEYEVLT